MKAQNNNNTTGTEQHHGNRTTNIPGNRLVATISKILESAKLIYKWMELFDGTMYGLEQVKTHFKQCALNI